MAYQTLYVIFGLYRYIRFLWFIQVLLCITNNSIKHQLFVYTVKWSKSFISNNSIYHKSFIFGFNVKRFYSYTRYIRFLNKSTKLNTPKYCYVLQISVICLHTVQWSDYSISNNSLQHKSTKLNGSKYCYVSLTIQLNNSCLFTQLND